MINNTERVATLRTRICRASIAILLFHGYITTAVASNVHQKCIHGYKQCITLCKNNKTSCRVISTKHTALRYRRYLHEQCVTGAVIARELNSYQDPLQCKKTTCDCNADYVDCMGTCMMK